jgi:hypothetical protein
MSLKMYVCFYHTPWFMHRIMGLVYNCVFNHVAIQVENEDLDCLLLVDKKKRTSFISSEVYHKKHPYKRRYYIKDITFKEMGLFRDLINEKKRRRFKPTHVIFWFYVARWLSKWKPPSTCTVIVSEMLRLCGIGNKVCVIPIDLSKELDRHEYHYVCGEGESW